MLNVYLAGPDVFMPMAEEIGNTKKQLLAAHQHCGHFPTDPDISDFKHDADTAYQIFQGNEALMRRCQVILANMTPFHGPSIDAGTAVEVGYFSAKADREKVLIIGYYEQAVEMDFTKRVAQTVYQNQVVHHQDGSIRSKQGVSLEQFGLSDNLMISCAIRKTGGQVFASFEEAVANIKRLWDMNPSRDR